MMQKPFSAPKHGGSIVIYDWMVRLYSLQGDNLLIYATIHSFSKKESGVFKGSLRYLAFWTGRSKPTVLKSLKYLQSRDLIVKKPVSYTRLNQNRHYCEYWTKFSRLSEEEKSKLINSSF